LRWEQLAGNDRVRFCGHCQQNVYNVASLTMDEATALIQRCEGRVCMRLQRRADGTVITRDCFHVVRRARERIVGTALGLAVMALGFWTGMVGLREKMEARFVPPPPPRCPPPPPAPPEPEIPEWLMRGAPDRQGGVGVRHRSRERVLGHKPKLPAPAMPQPPPQPPARDKLEDLGLATLRL
jgi:hypothetical protein